MATPLFRPAAIEARREGRRGEPLWVRPVPANVFAMCATALLGLAAWGALTLEAPRRITVRGYLAAPEGAALVRSPIAANVVATAVEEGATVRAGDALVHLETRRSTSDSASTADDDAQDRADLRRTVESQAEVAVERLDAAVTETERRLERIARERASVAAQLALNDARHAAAVARHAELAIGGGEGVVPRAMLIQQRDRVDELALESLRLRRALLDLEQRAADAAAARLSARNEFDLRAAELEAARTRLALEARAQSRAEDAVVRAPREGVVARLLGRHGTTVLPGQLLAVIAPADVEPQAVLWVPARTAGPLAVGQRVVLRIDAYPHQRHGVRHATIVRIAGAATLGGDVDSPIPPTEPSFEVRARLDPAPPDAQGGEPPLRVDLTLEADVVVERLTLVDRLLDPLRAFTRRAG